MLYIKDEEEYTESNSIPTNGYTLNAEKSVCKTYDGSTSLEEAPIDSSITIEYSSGKVNFLGVNKRNTRCYLYFDKQEGLTSQDIIAANNPKTEAPDFSKTATTDEGVFKVADGMYGGTSYYWRGAVTNNYVKFANFCWRIVRINGDGTMRLIYDGTTCHANGNNSSDSIIGAGQDYSISHDRSEYVGYTYTEGLQRPSDSTTATASNLKKQAENWYKSNILNKGYDGRVATGKFCNDRELASNSSPWESQASRAHIYYAAYGRLTAKTPTLNCSNSEDVYRLKAGAITVDEVMYAGGVSATVNSKYYLCNGLVYWTMSPLSGFSDFNNANVYLVFGDGYIRDPFVNNDNYNIRPVINLLSNTQFKVGTMGTLDNPYEVV